MADLESAAEVIRRHPEVKSVVLEWVRPFGSVCRMGVRMDSSPDDFMVGYVGECFDWERCVCGSNRSAASQLSECGGCWDGLVNDGIIARALDGGTLRIRHVEPLEDPLLSSYVPPSVAGVRARILRRAKMPESFEEHTFYRRWPEWRGCRGIAAVRIFITDVLDTGIRFNPKKSIQIPTS